VSQQVALSEKKALSAGIATSPQDLEILLIDVSEKKSPLRGDCDGILKNHRDRFSLADFRAFSQPDQKHHAAAHGAIGVSGTLSARGEPSG
jgi:hypothetical protein